MTGVRSPVTTRAGTASRRAAAFPGPATPPPRGLATRPRRLATEHAIRPTSARAGPSLPRLPVMTDIPAIGPPAVCGPGGSANTSWRSNSLRSAQPLSDPTLGCRSIRSRPASRATVPPAPHRSPAATRRPRQPAPARSRHRAARAALAEFNSRTSLAFQVRVAGVHGHAIQPRRESCPAVKRRQMPHNSQEYLLGQVVRGPVVQDHLVHQRPNASQMSPDQFVQNLVRQRVPVSGNQFFVFAAGHTGPNQEIKGGNHRRSGQIPTARTPMDPPYQFRPTARENLGCGGRRKNRLARPQAKLAPHGCRSAIIQSSGTNGLRPPTDFDVLQQLLDQLPAVPRRSGR